MVKRMEFLTTIATRKSTRKYKPTQISAKELNTILSAGSVAPVGANAYGNYHFTVVQNAELIEKINIATSNARNNIEGMEVKIANTTYGAPTLVVVSAKIEPKFHGIELANVGCLVENMLLAATDLGVGSVFLMAPVLGFKADPQLVKDLQLPEDFEPMSVVALGYPVDSLKEKELKMKITVNSVL